MLSGLEGIIFQSTLPRGERLYTLFTHNFLSDFNPRSHEGSDGNDVATGMAAAEFQSTLPRGERHPGAVM